MRVIKAAVIFFWGIVILCGITSGTEAQLQGLWTNPPSSACTNTNPQTIFCHGGLAGWWDANNTGSVTLNSGNVSAWANLASGGTATLTQATAASQPLYDVATDVNFNGSAKVLGFGSAPSPPYEMVTVATPGGGGHDNVLLYDNSSIYPNLCQTGTNAYAEFSGAHHQYGTFTCSGIGLFDVYVPSTVVAPSGETNGGTPAAAALALAAAALFDLGNDGSGSQFGPDNEVVLASRQMTTTERQLIEGFEACKWDHILSISTIQAALPMAHPFSTTNFTCPGSFVY